MWYGCLPSAVVMGVALSVPYVFVYFVNKYIVGNPYRRLLTNKYDCHTYLRDMRLGNGDPYKQLGLNCLADEPVEEVKVCECA